MDATTQTEIYACGNNAWRQLEDLVPENPLTSGGNKLGVPDPDAPELDEPLDFYEFRKVLSVENEEVLGIWAGLSWVVVYTTEKLYQAGMFSEPPSGTDGSDLHLQARIGTGLLQSSEDFLSLLSLQPKFDRIDSQSGLNVRQVVANNVCYTVLCDDGSVWSWGDGRFPGCLGRGVDEESLASAPTVISSLLSSNIESTVTKIASGGYITAALTSAHDIYIWGSPDPVQSRSMVPSLSGDPTPLLISNPDNPDQEFDFSDVGVGFRHVIVLTTDQRVFVVGANGNGQLGLGDECAKDVLADAWKEVDLASLRSVNVAPEGSPEDKVVVGVAAGENASFVMLKVKKAG